jgi:hypothetical protein
VPQQERHLLGRDGLRRKDEITLVLADFVIDDEHHVAAPHGDDRCLNV